MADAAFILARRTGVPVLTRVQQPSTPVPFRAGYWRVALLFFVALWWFTRACDQL
jgi:hypothetical protein